MNKFLKNLFSEIASQGKLLAAYAATQIPAITSFPGIGTAFHTALADHTPASYVDLAIQVLMATSATMRAGKIVVAAANKS